MLRWWKSLRITIRAAIITVIGGGIFALVASVLPLIIQYMIDKPVPTAVASVSPTPNAAALYITQELKLSPNTTLPDGRIVFEVGQAVTATMRIKNQGTDEAVMDGLGVAVRGPSACDQGWRDNILDFPTVQLTLRPGEEYIYQQTRSFDAPGTYFAEPLAKLIGRDWGGIPLFRRIYFFVRDPQTGSVPNPIDCVTPVLTPTAPLPTPTLEPIQATAMPIILTGSPVNWIPSFDDIPKEMKLVDSGPVSNEDVAAGDPNPIEFLKMLEEWGRIESYYQIYSEEDQCQSTSGLYEVKVSVALFKTPLGAETSRSWYVTNWENKTRLDATDIVGENAHLVESQKNSECNPSDAVAYVTITFRRYNVVVYVDVGSLKNVAKPNDMQTLAIRLARLVDQRLIDAAK